MKKRNLVWLRRDLRLHDHLALSEATKNDKDDSETYLAFIFDPSILDKLPTEDRRVTFIAESLEYLQTELSKLGKALIIRFGNPEDEIPKIIEEYQISNLFFNRDYEPKAKVRDQNVKNILKRNNISVFEYKDHVFYEKHEVLSLKGEIFKVFTPYKNKWLEKFKNEEEVVPLYKVNLNKIASPKETIYKTASDILNLIDFKNTPDTPIKGGTKEAQKRINVFKEYIENYHDLRNYLPEHRTSLLSVHLRHGTISLRDCLRTALEYKKSEGGKIWLSELIWRDFYQMILDVYPRVEKSCYKIHYEQIKWPNNKEHFKAWCEGRTGFPIVDAAMRELNATGMMNNRLRMVVASFLCKTLLIEYRWGEKYFAEKLLDFDLAANNGGWQWSASTGVDAQPYFRIFNPYSQSEKFDPTGDYIRSWCPELSDFDAKTIHSPQDQDLIIAAKARCTVGIDYPSPIVSYKVNREAALKLFKAVSKEDETE